MKKLNRVLRLIVLILVICMASIIPVPITFHSRDNLPKDLIELVKNQDKEERTQKIDERR